MAREISWVSPDNYHLTLKFIGDVDDERAGEIGAALAVAVNGIQAFDIALRGLGAFPTPARPRVIWAGVTGGGPPLADLARAVETAMASLGFPPEPRIFSAHVTLGRVREPRRNSDLAEALDRAASADLGVSSVDRVVLMRSQLSRRGARYSELAMALLAGHISRET